MITYPVIASAAVPTARVEDSGAVVNDPPATLPIRAIGVGQFTVGTSKSGLPQLVDPHGNPCGIFASQRLAEDTAAGLSQ